MLILSYRRDINIILERLLFDSSKNSGVLTWQRNPPKNIEFQKSPVSMINGHSIRICLKILLFQVLYLEDFNHGKTENNLSTVSFVIFVVQYDIFVCSQHTCGCAR